MNNRINKLLHEFFYDCHRKLWNAIIEYIKNNPDCDCINLVKLIVTRKIFGNIEIVGCCFGCHLTPIKPGYLYAKNCKQCFLGLSKTCIDWNLHFPKHNLLKNRIKTCEIIRDCGYILTKNQIIYNKMVGLFIEMLRVGEI